MYSTVNEAWSFELLETIDVLNDGKVEVSQMNNLYSHLLQYSLLTHNFLMDGDNRKYNHHLNLLNMELISGKQFNLEVPTAQYYYRQFYDYHRAIFNSLKQQILNLLPVTGSDLELKGMVIRL